MKFVTKKPPIVQSSENTYKRVLSLHIAIIVMSVSAIFMNGFHNIPDGESYNLDQAFSVFGMLVIAAIVAVMVEIFYRLSEGDTTRFSSYAGFVDPLSTGLLIALLLPLNTPIYVLVLAVIVGTYAGKLVFGGFGYYIFNPVLVGVIFVSLSFSGQLAVYETPLLLLKEVFTSDATFTGIMLQDLLIGNYAAIAVGSTSVIMLGLLFIYLSITKVIDLRLSGTFLLTVLLMSFGIGMFLWDFNTGAPISYVIVNLFTGLTMFAAVFLVSEPVSTPTSRETKIIFGVTVAVLMMLMRTLSDNAEGIVFAVLFGNMITPFINRTVKRSNKKALIKTVIACVIIVAVATVSIGFILQGQLEELRTASAVIGGIL